MTSWIEVGAQDGLAPEDVLRFDYGGTTYAIYRSADSKYSATDGLCTHESVHLAEGFVSGYDIECPKHGGIFDYTTGEAKGSPVCIDLQVYPMRTEGGRLFIGLP